MIWNSFVHHRAMQEQALRRMEAIARSEVQYHEAIAERHEARAEAIRISRLPVPTSYSRSGVPIIPRRPY